jgi:putative ABC transport system substrate-binding protein
MDEKSWRRSLNASSDNPESKTCTEQLSRSVQNKKWAGFLAIFLSLLGCVGMAAAQQPKKIAKIGYLFGSTPATVANNLEAFRQGMRELGHVEGKTFLLELRYGEARVERFPELARELVNLKVDVIVTATDVAIAAVKRETQTIPIVMAVSNDPVGTGFVASLARPGGNVTGLSTISPELSGKRLELLKEVVPGLSRVAFLWNPDLRGAVLDYNQTEGAAGSLGLQLQSVEVSRAEDLDRAFSTVTKERGQALMMPAGNPVGFVNRGRIATFAQKNKLPSMFGQKEYVEAGGLISYGPSTPDMHRRAATYVDKILKGRKPADLPVERPTKFELVINLKTAKQIGLTIPPNVLARADKVIK